MALRTRKVCGVFEKRLIAAPVLQRSWVRGIPFRPYFFFVTVMDGFTQRDAKKTRSLQFNLIKCLHFLR